MPVNLSDYPRVESTLGIADHTFLLDGGESVEFDFENIAVIGPVERLSTSPARYYGFRPAPPAAPPTERGSGDKPAAPTAD